MIDYGMVSEVDLQIGRVVDALEESGNMDNTIIVFARKRFSLDRKLALMRLLIKVY